MTSSFGGHYSASTGNVAGASAGCSSGGGSQPVAASLLGAATAPPSPHGSGTGPAWLSSSGTSVFGGLLKLGRYQQGRQRSQAGSAGAAGPSSSMGAAGGQMGVPSVGQGPSRQPGRGGPEEWGAWAGCLRLAPPGAEATAESTAQAAAFSCTGTTTAPATQAAGSQCHPMPAAPAAAVPALACGAGSNKWRWAPGFPSRLLQCCAAPPPLKPAEAGPAPSSQGSTHPGKLQPCSHAALLALKPGEPLSSVCLWWAPASATSASPSTQQPPSTAPPPPSGLPARPPAELPNLACTPGSACWPVCVCVASHRGSMLVLVAEPATTPSAAGPCANTQHSPTATPDTRPSLPQPACPPAPQRVQELPPGCMGQGSQPAPGSSDSCATSADDSVNAQSMDVPVPTPASVQQGPSSPQPLLVRTLRRVSLETGVTALATLHRSSAPPGPDLAGAPSSSGVQGNTPAAAHRHPLLLLGLCNGQVGAGWGTHSHPGCMCNARVGAVRMCL